MQTQDAGLYSLNSESPEICVHDLWLRRNGIIIIAMESWINTASKCCTKVPIKIEKPLVCSIKRFYNGFAKHYQAVSQYFCYHQIDIMIRKPLFRVRSCNNGMLCVLLYS